jgi:predicted dehydrogenase/threonine dehydrogenase-like Zn-dependent dehydrogenase
MKIITQNLKSGSTELTRVPCPSPTNGQVLIQTSQTLISAGTERMLVEFGKANLVEKALQQPEKVKMVLGKLKTDGLQATVETVLNKLDEPLPLGYCNIGRVLDIGHGVSGLEIGDRVVSNGYHSEAVCVPRNLTAKVPERVTDEEAAFTVLAAIALQGIRLVKPTLGECFVVSGLGLVGLLTVQLLRANGCRVLGLDFDKDRLRMAEEFGADTFDLSSGQPPLFAAERFSRGRGVDGVLLTVATSSDDPISHAAQMCRKLGRVVLVGVTGLNLSREDFFKKEISLQVSASYGPGRYDPNYEEKGHDYPIGYVRWTEQRNFEAVLDMMASGSLDVKPLISHRFAFDDCEKAYDLVAGSSPSLGILLEYQKNAGVIPRTIELADSKKPTRRINDVALGFIGAGNYASAVLIPAFQKNGANLDTIISTGGLNGMRLAQKYGFRKAGSSADEVFQDSSINAVVVSTRHDSHGKFVLEALASKKHVFIEKPLCLTRRELSAIQTEFASQTEKQVLMVGFNRRFSPLVREMHACLKRLSAPKSMIMTVNAGAIPSDHWVQDREIGGGRILGEACHFVDLLRHLAGAEIVDADIKMMDSTNNDTATLSLSFADGSIGTINYFANGHRGVAKEQLDVYCNGGIFQLDNFRGLKAHGCSGVKSRKLWRQDKGQVACAKAFLDALSGDRPPPIPYDELIEVQQVLLDLKP